jgi:hypothetical protein
MALPDLTGQNIQDTYQRVVQTDGTSTFDGTGSSLPISFDGNNVIVTGALTAQTYVVSESILNVSSGSTVFGNSIDDTHNFIGSITASNRITISSSIANQAKIMLEDYGGGDPSVNFRSGSTQKAVIGHDASTTYSKFLAGGNLTNTTGIVMDGSGRIAINTNPTAGYDLILSTHGIAQSWNISSNGTSKANFSNGEAQSTGMGLTQGLHELWLWVQGTPSTKLIQTVDADLPSLTHTGSILIHTEGDVPSYSIQASGNISSSAEFIGTSANISNITSSGNISASGHVYANLFYAQNNYRIQDSGGSSRHFIAGPQAATVSNNSVQIGNTNFTDGIQFISPITASGNISASGTITANKIEADLLISHAGDANTGLQFGADTVWIEGNDVVLANFNTTYIDFPAGSHITASGNISSSGDLLGNTLTVLSADTDRLLVDQIGEKNSNDGITITHNITASGDISSSGLITGKINTTDTNADAAHYFMLQTAVGTLPLTSNGMNLNPSNDVLTVGGGIKSHAHITASGNISSSGTITANDIQFNTLTGTIDGGSF